MRPSLEAARGHPAGAFCPARQSRLSIPSALRSRRARIRLSLAVAAPALLGAACVSIPFDAAPASGYAYGSGAPLRVAVIDGTGGDGAWSPAVDAALAAYGQAAPMLRFQRTTDGANIVVDVRRYDDGQPPELRGYVFPLNAGGFATVYDAAGVACNYPPSPLPLSCSGEIATATIYLNDVIPPGADIEARRERLVLHELGHSMGLTRHSPDLAIDALAARYGWQ